MGEIPVKDTSHRKNYDEFTKKFDSIESKIPLRK